MTKLKFAIIALIFLLFSLFIGIQVNEYGTQSFAIGFFATLAFSIFVFIVQVEYYIFAVKSLTSTSDGRQKDYTHPLDIWLVAIPFTVIMIIAYLVLGWYIVEIFYCTTLALIGMLFGNALGRGSKKWSIKKSLPFFIGILASTIYAFILGAMM